MSDLFIKLSLNFFFCLSSVRGRCFWASQILWWILTSSEQKFCFDCKPLLEFYLDGIVLLDETKCSVVLLDLLSQLSLNFFFCLSSVRGRCFWASQILWWILTSSEQKFCFDCKPLLESYLDGIVAFRRFKMLCCFIRFIMMLSLNFFFCLSSVRGRCFWASQILWWILTSSEQKFCFDCKPLLESYLEE